MKTSRILGALLIAVFLFQNIAFAADTTPPDAPDSVMIEASDSSVNISWSVPNDDTGVVNYEIHYGPTSISENGGNYAYDIESEYNAITVVFLSNGTTYYFSIKAFDAAGNESVFSEEVSTTPYGIETPETNEDYEDVEILEYEVEANSVTMTITNQALSSDYSYYYTCHMMDQGSYNVSFDRRFTYDQPSDNTIDPIELVADGLKPETEYYCYAGIVDPIDDVINHSETIYVTTGGDGILAENVFSDISYSHPNKDAISFLYNTKIIQGYSDGTFKPDNEINRAELVKVLVESAGMTPSHHTFGNCFTDVGEEWFAPYVCYAEWAGWVEGYSDGSFKPAQTVNKVEALKLLFVSQGIDITEVYTQPFSDTPVSEWYAPYVAMAKDMGILEETGSYFEPGGLRTRGEIAENIYRMLVTE